MQSATTKVDHHVSNQPDCSFFSNYKRFNTTHSKILSYTVQFLVILASFGIKSVILINRIT